LLRSKWPAAEATGCTRILSEDLSDQASYFGIQVENPFKTPV
jgi:predicted nucleic acid-binding protein